MHTNTVLGNFVCLRTFFRSKYSIANIFFRDLRKLVHVRCVPKGTPLTIHFFTVANQFSYIRLSKGKSPGQDKSRRQLQFFCFDAIEGFFLDSLDAFLQFYGLILHRLLFHPGCHAQIYGFLLILRHPPCLRNFCPASSYHLYRIGSDAVCDHQFPIFCFQADNPDLSLFDLTYQLSVIASVNGYVLTIQQSSIFFIHHCCL